MSAPFAKVAVVGAGQMGAGIAQVCAMAGMQTVLFDARSEVPRKAIASMEVQLKRQIEKGKITQADLDAGLAHIQPVTDLKAISDAEIIIEAIVENIEAKQALFTQLDSLCPPATIIASSTSSISITKLAAATSRPEKVIGLHFMNPVPVMELVEVIRGLQTTDDTYQKGLSLVAAVKKTAVTACKDYPGFIVNRILVPMLNEAFYVLMEGIAAPEEIDAAMKLGTNQPMGPLALADFVGLDTCLAICEIFHRELGEDKYRPCPLMRKYVEAGWLGRKSGRGVFNYAK
jgi:3-hydroxybutyryl-CoA dehydrogenase